MFTYSVTLLLTVLDQLRNLIFTHSPGFFNPSLLTLHTLFSVAFSPPISVSVADAYREACSSLLEGFGIHGELLQYDALISKVALALVSIARMLLVTTHVSRNAFLLFLDSTNQHDKMQAFISTFKLLTSLCICIPSFTDTLLLIEDTEGACTLIPVICNVIQNKMPPMAPEFQGETYSQVSITVIELLEALFYTAGDNLVDRYANNTMSSFCELTIEFGQIASPCSRRQSSNDLVERKTARGDHFTDPSPARDCSNTYVFRKE